MNIPFNRQPIINTSVNYITQALQTKGSGDGEFTRRCSSWMEAKFDAKRVLLTTSCTHALEMSAILCDIKLGDEVIMPSFTFTSTATAFVIRGAKIVFVDIRPDTMNIDETLIEKAITDKTKAIVPVHYAGVGCEMDYINEIAKKHNLFVIEDAAQGVMASYNGRALGTLGDFGCYSFHETKNFSMGEGGALLINDESSILQAEIIREKGTNRSRFFRGEIDKYSWMDMGSSYLPSDINAAYLLSQLEIAEDINNNRLSLWNLYYEELESLQEEELLMLPIIPPYCNHNAHMFYIKVKDNSTQERLIAHLKSMGVSAVFHYIPLHSSEAGEKFGRFHGEDRFTTKESERLIRLPLYYEMPKENVGYVCKLIKDFY